MDELISGAEMVMRALKEQGVKHIFGYPGGAVLPIYDVLFEEEDILHVLVRHEQGAVHAAEGYARTSGRCGVCLVTSGPGLTNAVTGLTDALMDSHPLVVISGQVPTHLIGSDAFQECDSVGITRACTKHNYLVKDINALSTVMHEAFHLATSGRPGPVLIDIPKDVQFAKGVYNGRPNRPHKSYRPTVEGDARQIERAVDLMMKAKRPVFYTGGGIVNAGEAAWSKLTELVDATGFPITSTLMGLGAYSGLKSGWLGMLGMHGTYEANLAMHDCDLMIAIGARFDDRITGKVSDFSPRSKKVHIDIDPSSINKIVDVDIPIVGDAAWGVQALLSAFASRRDAFDREKLKPWWQQIDQWRARKCLQYEQSDQVIMPQFAIERLYAMTRERETYVTTEVGQHQMWAAQFFPFENPRKWSTSGGLGTMGYGVPASIGMQLAHPDALVIDIAGEASVLMTLQELGTAVQYRLPVKIFILNNEYMGMVRQWQELLHGNRISHSYSEALPDFVKLAEAYGCLGLRVDEPKKLDETIQTMIDYPGPVVVDCRVSKVANIYPMIPSGQAHNKMMMPDPLPGVDAQGVTEEGKLLV